MSSDGTGKDVVTVKVPPSQGTGSAKADSSESHTQTESSGKPSQTFEAPATLVSPPTPITVVDSTAEDVSDANELLHASSASQLDTSVNRSRSNSLLSVSTNAGSELPRELSGGNCTVHVEGASAVPKKGDSLPDTYVKIARGGHNVVRSKIVKKSISPAWNESGTVRLRDREPCTFDIEVKSHRLLDSDVIGTAKFDLRKHLHDESDKWTKEGAWVWDGTLALDTGILLRFGVVFQPGSAPPSPATSESKLSNGGLFHLRRSASNRHAVDDT
ncbi:hypothetical protein M427DRAFT_452550 [Gonapodya prolifera JEL478]|uniref:C2 domain-containing protein n=1 Tax=Gonapodya prolifera (strain JEL478) TaxID=1344416 RepID=A0A139AS16_GONPJ|nr:hypothetical protein M427DRAFT_452550 [Gonapodya prolifera JEL478]|eukprot:KXS19530.1 hypothetical protein M427DRAFT_452550 [Gonapodya prolifera JEL478]